MKAQVRDLHAKGLSASQMMVYFPGKTRNAIMGTWKRLGLCESRPKSILASPKARATSPPSLPVIDLPPAGSFLPMRAPIDTGLRSANGLRGVAKTPDASEFLAQGVAYGDLSEGVCNWPLNQFKDGSELYCGGKALPRKPYCAHHTRIGSVKSETKPRIPYKHRNPGKYSRL
jgi:hypothetical protein